MLDSEKAERRAAGFEDAVVRKARASWLESHRVDTLEFQTKHATTADKKQLLADLDVEGEGRMWKSATYKRAWPFDIQSDG